MRLLGKKQKLITEQTTLNHGWQWENKYIETYSFLTNSRTFVEGPLLNIYKLQSIYFIEGSKKLSSKEIQKAHVDG